MKRTYFHVAIQIVILILIVAIQSPLLAKDTAPTEDYFDMELEELLELEISVASKKPESTLEAPGVVVVVPREEFTVYGDRNLWQLMQRQPSVYTREAFPYSDNVMGFRGDMSVMSDIHTLFLFNGRPIRENAQAINVNMYDAFPLAALDSVELVRGPGSVLYGSNAFTGVVNLKSRAIPEKTTFAVSTLGGSYGYYQTTVSTGGCAGNLGVTADIQVAGDDGYPYQMVDAMGVYGSSGDHHRSFSGVMHLRYGGLTFDMFGSDIDNFTLGAYPLWSNPHHGISNQKWFGNLGYRVPVHDRVTVELNATYNLQENVLSSPAPQRIGTNTSDWLGEATVFINPVDPVNLVLGFLKEDRTNYAPDDDYFQSITNYHYRPESVYTQGDWKVNKCLKLIAGMQWNKSSQGLEDIVSRYGIILTPHKNWGVKLLRGEAFRAPTTMETDLSDPLFVGNKNLKPERITTYDAQLFYHNDKTYAAVTYFHSTISDLTIYDDSVTPVSFTNAGEHRFEGVEFEAKYFLTPRWHVLGSAMHQHNKHDIGNSPTVAPNDMVKFGTAYTWDWGTASLFYCLFSKPPEIYFPSLPPPFGSTLVVNPKPEAINLVNLNVDLDVSKWMGLAKGQSTLTLRVENLLDEEIYVPTFAYIGSPNSFPYGPGRTFYIGLELHN